jgi:Fe-S-cluster containining protein
MKFEEVNAELESIAKADPVQCNGCTACCKGNLSVALNPDWGDRIEDHPQRTLALEDIYKTGHLSVVLKRKPNGDCIHLRHRGCAIYDKRPAVCRRFDCRRAFWEFRDQRMRKEAIEHKHLPATVFAEGRKRIHSLRLQPLEVKVEGMMQAFRDQDQPVLITPPPEKKP